MAEDFRSFDLSFEENLKRSLLIFLFIFCLPLRLLSFELNDKAWRPEDYQRFFVGNLLINGDLSLANSPPMLHQEDGYVQLRKCWSLVHSDYLKVRDLNKDPSQSGIILGGASNVEIVGRTLSYRDVDGLLRDIAISVKGTFHNSDVIAKVLFCRDECTEVLVPLKAHQGELRGVLHQKHPGSIISSFSLIVKGGVESISAVSIGGRGAKVIEGHLRDQLSSEICHKPPGVLKGGGVYDFSLLLFVTSLGIAALLYFVRRQEWFFAVIVTAWLSFSFFGIWGLYFGVSEYRLAQGVVDRSRIVALGVVSVTSLIFLSIGWLSSQKIFSFLKARKSKEMLGIRYSVILYIILASIVCILALPSLLSFLQLYIQCNGTHCATALAQVRQEITDLGFLKPHYQRLLFYHLTTLLSYLIVSQLLRKTNFQRLILLGIVIFVQFILIAFNGEKAPILWYCFGLLFVLLSSGLPVLRRKEILFLILISGAPVVLAMIGSSFADRLTFGSLTVAYRLLEVFPDKMSFLGGISLFDPLHIFGGNQFDLPFYMWRVIHPELVFSSIQGTSVTAFWGEAYANFGWPGFFISSFILGFFIGAVALFVRRFASASECLAITAWLVFRYVVFSESLFLTLILDFYLVGLVAVVAFLAFGKRAVSSIFRH